MRTPEENKRAAISYEAAYQVVRRCALDDPDRFESAFVRSPDLAAIEYYTRAAGNLGQLPGQDDLRLVRGHIFGLEDHDAWVIQYPRFEAENLLGRKEPCSSDFFSSHVLAPYFSAALVRRGKRRPVYYVLGQAPDGCTTLRRITRTTNVNCGRGCEPELAEFIEMLSRRAENGEDG